MRYNLSIDFYTAPDEAVSSEMTFITAGKIFRNYFNYPFHQDYLNETSNLRLTFEDSE